MVGVGNSGAEIALEVSRSHPTWLAGAPSGQLPVRHGRAGGTVFLPRGPLRRTARSHHGNTGGEKGERPGMTSRETPLIRTKMSDLAAAGVHLVPRMVGSGRFPGMAGVVDGDSALSVANIIWCTGDCGDFSWVDLPGFQEGKTAHAVARSRAFRAGALFPRPGVSLFRSFGYRHRRGGATPSTSPGT